MLISFAAVFYCTVYHFRLVLWKPNENFNLTPTVLLEVHVSLPPPPQKNETILDKILDTCFCTTLM